MAVRQYIGARYVLKIYENSQDPLSAEWEANTTYEPLVMVNYNNSSYISRKNVPPTVGNPVDNPAYWALSGLYNGQIANLQQQINTIGAEVANIDTVLPTKIDDIGSRTILFVGDSYDVVNANHFWSEYAATMIKPKAFVRRSTGGFGFAPTTGYTWKNLLINNPVPDPDAITDVVIGGGTNDTTQTTANVLAAISDFDTYIRATFPNLKRVYLAYMGWSHLNQTQRSQHYTMLECYKKGAKEMGWRFLHGVQYVMRNPQYILTQGLNDRVHPNVNGVDELGRCVAEAYLSGSVEVASSFVGTFTLNSDKVTATNPTFDIPQYQDNALWRFSLPDLNLTAAADLSSYFTLATCPELNEAFNQFRYWQGFVAYGGNTYDCILVSLNENELTLWLRGGVTIPNGTSFQLVGLSYMDFY